MDLQELVDRSWAIRQAYHNLEVKYHDSKWTVEEDLLALSNDIGNFLRLVMTKQGDATMMKYPTHWNKTFRKYLVASRTFSTFGCRYSDGNGKLPL